MVKECKVLINNDAVTVIKYDDIKVQVPSIHRTANTVKVLYKNGKYTVVDDDYIEQKSKKKKKTVEETTINDVDENIDETEITENTLLSNE